MKLRLQGIVNNSKTFFLVYQRTIFCDTSLEPSRQDNSNDRSQQMF